MNIFGDQSIKTGDLAMVVRDCCGRWLGTPLKVRMVTFVPAPGVCRCDTCGREYSNIDVVTIADPQSMLHSPLYWLKKIDPPREHETERHEEEITA